MTQRSVAHGVFTVERTYDASPARVFGAWADPRIKGKWYGDPNKESVADIFEFKVGGRELRTGPTGDGQTYSLDSRYYDIVENERIVHAYEVVIDGARTSVSVATIEFRPLGQGTRLTITEQGAFLDGIENPDERVGGTNFVLDRLGQVLAEQVQAIAK
jgi:uncharacterized protein YndB with AHSA1/START domain